MASEQLSHVPRLLQFQELTTPRRKTVSKHKVLIFHSLVKRAETGEGYTTTREGAEGYLWAPVTPEGDGTPLQYSCLENPMDGGAW